MQCVHCALRLVAPAGNERSAAHQLELCSGATGRHEQQQSFAEHCRSSAVAAVGAAAAAAAAALGPMPSVQHVVSMNTQAASKTTEFCVWLLYLTCCWTWCWTLHSTLQAEQGMHTLFMLAPTCYHCLQAVVLHAFCMQLYTVALASCSRGLTGLPAVRGLTDQSLAGLKQCAVQYWHFLLGLTVSCCRPNTG
jgi:hypothetical protein